MCRLNETMALYAEMQQQGLRPDSYTLTALLTACERVDKWDQASRLFDELTAAGVQPDVRNYNSLIYTLGKGGQWAQVCTEPSLLSSPKCAQECADGEPHPCM
jgi:pentatricopeptide repeat protein